MSVALTTSLTKSILKTDGLQEEMLRNGEQMQLLTKLQQQQVKCHHLPAAESGQESEGKYGGGQNRRGWTKS